MEVHYGLAGFKTNKPVVLTTGTFDGVHLGHKKIIDRINTIAKNINGTSVLLTFSPHPRLILFPEKQDLKLLNTAEEKIALLEKTGLEHLIIYPFTKEFSQTSALEYVEELLVKQIKVNKYVIGYDHQFGKNREGSLENLQKMAPSFGFDVEEIPAEEINSVNISSTKIRAAINEGSLQEATAFLGHFYTVIGKVVKGMQLGRKIGFPTANIFIEDTYKLIPAKGVYAIFAKVEGNIYPGMMNIGSKPSVSSSNKVELEVHIFDFNNNLYNNQIQIYFVTKVRNELKFDSLELLKNQLEKDKNEIQEILSTVNF